MAKKTKKCSKCGETKSLGEFHQHPGTKDRRHTYCKVCLRAYNAARHRANPEVARARHVRRRYGLALEEYDEIMRRPCALCGAPSEHLDHDHETGRVRGALCTRHNLGLGNFNDDPAFLRRAADYLELHYD